VYRLCYVLLLLLVPIASFPIEDSSRAIKDPTRPISMVQIRQSHNKVLPALKSILNSQHRRLAIIDGHVLAEGDEVAGIRLLEIDGYGVVLSVDGGVPISIPLGTVSIRKDIK